MHCSSALQTSSICYANILRNAIVRQLHSPSGDTQGRKTFSAPSADKEATTMTQSVQTTISPDRQKALGLSHNRKKW